MGTELGPLKVELNPYIMEFYLFLLLIIPFLEKNEYEFKVPGPAYYHFRDSYADPERKAPTQKKEAQKK